jgi:hypothetical protein
MILINWRLVGLLDVDFEVLDGPELIEALGVLGDRCRRTAGSA